MSRKMFPKYLSTYLWWNYVSHNKRITSNKLEQLWHYTLIKVMWITLGPLLAKLRFICMQVLWYNNSGSDNLDSYWVTTRWAAYMMWIGWTKGWFASSVDRRLHHATQYNTLLKTYFCHFLLNIFKSTISVIFPI